MAAPAASDWGRFLPTRPTLEIADTSAEVVQSGHRHREAAEPVLSNNLLHDHPDQSGSRDPRSFAAA